MSDRKDTLCRMCQSPRPYQTDTCDYCASILTSDPTAVMTLIGVARMLNIQDAKSAPNLPF